MLSKLQPPLDPEEAALIRAIVADPDDDTPRLVYADWLDEHARPDRARLIRVQCALESLKTEERTLLEKFGAQWIKEAYGRCGEDHRFHRGFPEEVTMRFSTFLDHHATLNDYTPLRYLRLQGRLTDNMDDDLATLSRLPALQQVRSLEFDEPGVALPHSNYGPKGVEALAASPYLKGLQQLRLHSSQIGAVGAQIIANAPTFHNLTHLTLTDRRLCPPDFDAVAFLRSASLNRLKEVQLGEQQYGEHALSYIRSAPNPSGPDAGPTP
ncbi:Repeat-companion domain TIGR02996 OS=Singulisphaera acidiphila (strain ATCC BAA-1392 / DSM 18658 / VKM B-2454 / MOB10) GN=Sinac_4455 PE=4 SV=1 [Gemmata massiliana]|uniref:Repeat-companion domain TIGR02996 n=1 Tax=Gemmata massiliana TaxID=1210884 RepID=A0A6P2DE21_9BACT|nr:TIGR02996 domain-containing protein [Gemmata massiliana]VTS00426.1 Repeat-companion domain TIGR02996 OS=Singulisphaera acidiphila (strain ATCC BAA-1392 / DSM 18658 / VKM B-2454 / MOB10) GN=Sinac_4455 PE=4 SV=1 [Gemmata massiliana]